MKEMLRILKDRGYKQASLAVQKANYVVKMYQKTGNVSCIPWLHFEHFSFNSKTMENDLVKMTTIGK